MAWSIFTDGGGKGTAQAWAQSLLQAIGAPVTPATTQVVYDWEVSEGGGGQYNPLNQGPVPGHPELTISSRGGGSADYKSYAAGLQGAADYLSMSNFQAIKKALVAGNADAARAAIIASPWAGSHYGNGSAFSTEPLPGQTTALPGITNANFHHGAGDVAGVISDGLFVGFIKGLMSTFGITDIKDLAERAALLIVGFWILLIGIIKVSGTEERAKQGAKLIIGKGVSKDVDSKTSTPES